MSTKPQVHDIQFAEWGMRIAVLQENGTIEHEAELKLADHFGGVLPAVGDHFCPIGPGRNDDRLFQVVGRYWVDDFAGETCWWVIVKELEVDPIARSIFNLARKVTRQMRKVKAEADARVQAETDSRLLALASQRKKR
jgi:hypothetical protein